MSRVGPLQRYRSWWCFSIFLYLYTVSLINDHFLRINIKLSFSPQGWDAAGAKDNQDDKNYLNWALAVIRDLFFPGKKPKEIIEQGGDDSIKDDLDSGGKKDEGDVKVIFVSFL